MLLKAEGLHDRPTGNQSRPPRKSLILDADSRARCCPFSENNIGSEGIAALVPHLERLKALQTLDVRCMPLIRYEFARFKSYNRIIFII